mgnify:FL=1
MFGFLLCFRTPFFTIYINIIVQLKVLLVSAKKVQFFYFGNPLFLGDGNGLVCGIHKEVLSPFDKLG